MLWNSQIVKVAATTPQAGRLGPSIVRHVPPQTTSSLCRSGIQPAVIPVSIPQRCFRFHAFAVFPPARKFAESSVGGPSQRLLHCQCCSAILLYPDTAELSHHSTAFQFRRTNTPGTPGEQIGRAH